MKTNKIILGGLLGILTLVGLYIYKQSKLLSSLCYDFVSIDFKGSENSNSKLGLNFKFLNYSDVSVEITKYNINAYINGNFVGKLVDEKSFIIPPKGFSNIEFIAETNTSSAFSQVINSFLTQLIDKSESKFKIKGVASVRMGLIEINDYSLEWEWNTNEIMLNLKSKNKCPEIT